MPFITQDDDLTKQQAGAQTQGQGSIIGQSVAQGTGTQTDPNAPTTVSQGASGMITGSSGGGTGAVSPSSQAQSSGSYTNLQDYLKANQDNASTLGQNVGNQIRQVGQDATNQINTSANQFSTDVQGKTLANLDTAGTDASSIVNSAANTAKGGSVSANDLSRFKDISTANYAGPKTWQDDNVYQPAADKVAAVQTESDLSGTDQGRYALLQQAFGRPDYTSGQTNLDGMLLNRSQVGRDQLAQARQDVSGIGDQFTQAQNAGTQQAAQIAAQEAQVKNDAVNQFQQTQIANNSAVQARLDDVQKNWSNSYNDLMKTLGGYTGGALNLSAQQAQELGIGDNSRIYNMLNGNDPANYLTQNTYDAGKEITGDEQARLAALDQLALASGQTQLNKYNDPTQAGTQTINDALNAKAFGTEQANRQGQFVNYADNTTERGHGEGVHDNINWLGIKDGETHMHQDYAMSLADALAGSDPSFHNGGTSDTSGLNLGLSGGLSVYDSIFGLNGASNAGSEAQKQANFNAAGALQNSIANDLSAQGYQNQVHINPSAVPVSVDGSMDAGTAPVTFAQLQAYLANQKQPV